MDENYLSESKALYITNTLRTFAEAMIGIYVPIFIFNNIHLNFFPVDDVILAGVISIFIFYGLRSLLALIILPQTVDLIFGIFHFKGSIALGNIFLGLGLFILYLAPINLWLFLPISLVLLALNSAFYWIPYHTYFIRKAASSEGRYGKNVGTRQMLSRLAAASGPLIGAILISFFGFGTLFIVALCVLLSAGIPLLFSKVEHKHGKHNAVNILLKYVKDPRLTYDTIAFASMGIENVFFAILSPILLFSVSQDIAVIGLITSLSIGLSTIISMKIGKTVDDKGPYLMHKLGVTFNTSLYIIRAFSMNPYVIYTADFFDRINNNLFSIPFISSMYMHAKLGKHETDFVIYRTYITEIAVLLGTIFAVAFIVAFSNWQYLFLFLACISPLTYAINLSRPIAHKGTEVN